MSRSPRCLASFCSCLLYFSQRRDLERLTPGWSASPAIRRPILAASEALLDRAETELEAVLGTEYAGAERRADPGGQAVAEPTLVAPPVAGDAGPADRRRRSG